MTQNRFKGVWEEFVRRNGEQGFFAEAIRDALTLATESEQLRKRLAELENALAQANNKIKWYERTEATND